MHRVKPKTRLLRARSSEFQLYVHASYVVSHDYYLYTIGIDFGSRLNQFLNPFGDQFWESLGVNMSPRCQHEPIRTNTKVSKFKNA